MDKREKETAEQIMARLLHRLNSRTPEQVAAMRRYVEKKRRENPFTVTRIR